MKHPQCRGFTRTLRRASYGLCWIVLLSVYLAMPVNANVQTVHALLVIMDADPSLGSAMKANQQKMESLLTTIADEGNMHLKQRHLLSSHNEASKTGILGWLAQVNPAEQDIILIYFSGFGGKTPETGQQLEPFVRLQDGNLFQSDFAQMIQDIGNCRLKLLITDRCKGFLRTTPLPDYNGSPMFDQHVKIKHLFFEHEGFLHLDSAGAGEYGWMDEQHGGVFTNVLLHVIQQPSGSELDRDRDGFLAWEETFDLIRQTTENQFEAAYPLLSPSIKDRLHKQGIASQTPEAYALPKRLFGSPPGIESPLWALANSDASFSAFLNTDVPIYHVNDYLTLRILVTKGAHVIIINWDASGNLKQLFPNSYQEDNFVEAGTIHAFPDQQSDFDFALTGSTGVERFKVIAMRHAADSKAITNLIPTQDSGSLGLPNSERLEVEEKIMNYLRRVKVTDWAVASQTIELHDAKDSALPPNLGTPIRIESDYGNGDTVYVKDDSYMYFAEVTGDVNKNATTVAVHIFNEALRQKLGDTIPAELVLGRRVEPENGWGHHLVMLSFYRDGKWTFTKDVVVFEDDFLLPERVDEKPTLAPRKVKLSEVRIPIPVSFSSSEP